MNRDELDDVLAVRFGGGDGERRAVVRAAGDLADTGQYQTDVGVALTPPHVADELADAPDECSLAERWNWWIGSLELAYGGYEQFRVLRWVES